MRFFEKLYTRNCIEEIDLSNIIRLLIFSFEKKGCYINLSGVTLYY